jgi:hypothetical protein
MTWDIEIWNGFYIHQPRMDLGYPYDGIELLHVSWSLRERLTWIVMYRARIVAKD